MHRKPEFDVAEEAEEEEEERATIAAYLEGLVSQYGEAVNRRDLSCSIWDTVHPTFFADDSPHLIIPGHPGNAHSDAPNPSGTSQEVPSGKEKVIEHWKQLFKEFPHYQSRITEARAEVHLRKRKTVEGKMDLEGSSASVFCVGEINVGDAIKRSKVAVYRLVSNLPM